MIRRLKVAAGWIAELELGIVLLGVAPVLIFDAWMPRWAIGLALASIPGLWLIRWLGQGRLTRPTPLDVPILILLMTVPVGVWAAAIVSLSLPEVYRILLGVALYYSIVNTLDRARHLRLAATLLLVAAAILGFAAPFGTDWKSVRFSLPVLRAIYDWLPTVIRPFWNPEGFGKNVIGGGLAMMVPLLIASAMAGRRLLPRLAWATAALVGSLALILTQSRGGIIGLFVATLVMGIARSRWFLLSLPASALSGIALIQFVGLSRISWFFQSSAGLSPVDTLQGRLELWSRALYMIQDFSFTGIGLGMFDRVLDLLYPLFLRGPEAEISHPHNIFLSQAVNTGLPGLLAFLSLICLLLFMSCQSIRLARRGELWPLTIGLLGAMVAYLSHGLFDSITSFIKAHTILWGLFGLQTALWLHLQEPQRGEIQSS